MNNIWFKQYPYKGKLIYPTDKIKEVMEEQKAYIINTDQIRLVPRRDDRTRFRKLIDEIKRRLSHAWYALKGGECD